MPCWHWWHCWQHGQTVPDPRALCRATPGKCTLPRAEFSARRPTASPTEGTFDRSIGAPRSSSSSCLRSSRLHPRDRHPRHRDGRNPPIPSTCPSYRTARKSSPWDTFFPTSSCSNREGRLSSRRVPPFPPPPRRRRLVDSRAWQTSGPSWAQSPWNTRKARQSAVVAAGRGVGSAVCPTIGRGVLPRRRWRTILLRRHSGRRKCNSSSSSSSVGSVVSSSSSSPFSLPFSSS
mmetsp:Transcript_1164/g.2598  ORF Transcript_1164/g.2598 Transcript_1164/m.2598 type:complete len:233 (+) Transcript_1164:2651-3349(+)